MWISDSWQDFEVLDCSRGEKLERWGKYTLVRPDPQAIWDTPRTDPRWRTADGRYSRSHTGGGSWDKRTLPQSWDIRYRELTFRVKPMNFKHTGIFPEQAANWDYAMAKIDLLHREGRHRRRRGALLEIPQEREHPLPVLHFQDRRGSRRFRRCPLRPAGQVRQRRLRGHRADERRHGRHRPRA